MTYEIEVRDFPAQPIVSVRRTCEMADIQKTLAEILPAAFQYVMQQGAQPVGPPFTIYHSTPQDGAIDLEGGCPTAARLPGNDSVRACELPAGPAAYTWHVGPYDAIDKAYEALFAWVEANGRTPAGPPREVYWTDPMQEPDPARWKTEVILPLAP